MEGNTIMWGKRRSIFWTPTTRKLWFSKVSLAWTLIGEKALHFPGATSARLSQWAPKLVKVTADGTIKGMTCKSSIVQELTANSTNNTIVHTAKMVEVKYTCRSRDIDDAGERSLKSIGKLASRFKWRGRSFRRYQAGREP